MNEQTDLAGFDAAWLREKKEDLEFLQNLDYNCLKNKAETALNSGRSEKLIEAKDFFAQYDSQVLKDRSQQVSFPFLDNEIEKQIQKYAEISGPINTGIMDHIAQGKSKFMKAYQSKTPDIDTLRRISEDYAVFEGREKNLDVLLLDYAEFSRKLSKVEVRVADAAGRYTGIDDNFGFQKVKKKVLECKQDVVDIIGKHSSMAHAAYNYHNPSLETLSSEIVLFEKENFFEKKSSAEEQIKTADKIIHSLKSAKGEEAYTVLEMLTKQKFSDLRRFANTIYLGSIAENHSAVMQSLKESVSSCASGYQSNEIKNLGQAIDSALKKAGVNDLRAAHTSIAGKYSAKADLLSVLGYDSLKKTLDTGLSGIDRQAQDILGSTEKEKQYELSRKKIETDERLRKEEIGRKYDAERQADEFSKKEEQYKQKLQDIEKRSESLVRSLNEKKDRDKTVDALIENLGKTVQVGRESMDSLGKEISNGLYKRLCDQLARDLGRIEESMNKYSVNAGAIAGKLDSVQGDLVTIKNELAGLKERKELVLNIEQNNISNFVNEQKNEQELFDFTSSLKKMVHPTDENLYHIRKRLLGNEVIGMPNKILSLKDYFTSDMPLLDSIFNLEWLKELRDNLIEEVKFGIVGSHADNNGLSRDQFYDLIHRQINPYIKQCEKALQSTAA